MKQENLEELDLRALTATWEQLDHREMLVQLDRRVQKAKKEPLEPKALWVFQVSVAREDRTATLVPRAILENQVMMETSVQEDKRETRVIRVTLAQTGAWDQRVKKAPLVHEEIVG